MASTISSATSTSTTTTATSTKAASSAATTAKKSASQSLISKLGSGSGVDLNALATSLVEAERASQTESVNKNIAKNEARISGYAALKMTIDTVKSAFEALQKPSSVNLVSATSSNASAVTVSTTTGAIPGSHEISVTARAQGQRNLSTGFAATDTRLSNNDFYLQLSVNGKPKMIKVAAASATPAGMVSAINNAKLGVNAQLINSGDGSANPYKIVLNGPTGSSNAFTMVTDDGSGSSEQQKLVFSPATAAGSFKIGDVSVTVAAGDTGPAIAAKAKTALETSDSKNGISGRTYTVNNDGSLTIEYAKTDGDMDPVKVTDPLLTGVSAAVTTVRPFSVGQPLSATDTAKRQTLTLSDAGANGGTIAIGGTTLQVDPNETASSIADKVRQALASAGKSVLDLGNGVLQLDFAAANGDATLNPPIDMSAADATLQVQTVRPYKAKNALVDFNFGNRLQAAGDASFTLNGVAMARPGNTITDAIPGVTLNLLGTTGQAGPAILNVDRDTNALKDKVKALVDAFNTTMSDLKTLSGPKNTADPNDIYSGSLQNDSTIQLVKTQLRSMVLNNSASPGANVTALRDIGVSVDKTGVLTFDETKFDTTVSTNFDAVVTMLTANKESKSQYTTLPQGLAGDAVKRLTELNKATGYIQAQSTSAQQSVDRYKAQLDAIEARLTRLQDQYTKTFSNLDSLVGSINSQKTSLKSTFDAMLKSNNS